MAIGFAIVVFLTSLVGAVGVTEMRKAASAYEDVSEGSARRTKDALEMRVALERQVAGVRGYVLSGQASFLQPFAEAAFDFPTELRAVRRRGVSPADGALLDGIERDQNRLNVAFAAVLSDMERGRRAAAQQMLARRVEPLRDATREAVDAFVARQDAAFDAGRTAAQLRSTRAERVLLSLVAVVCLIGLIVAVVVLRRLGASARALRRQRDYAAALVTAMQDGIIVLSPTGARLEVNDRFCQMTGYSREQVLAGVSFWPDGADATRKRVMERILGDGGGEFDLRLQRADGTEMAVILTAAALADAEGRLSGYVTTVKDMTQRVHEQIVLRASERRAREFAAEQAAVLRVATAVAAGAEPDAVFALVAEECAHVLGAELGLVVRFDGERTEPVGTFGLLDAPASATMLLLGVDGAVDQVRAEGTPMRRDAVGALDVRSGAAAPVRVAGRLWGALAVADVDQTCLPKGAEVRLGRFAELIAMGIVNADTRAELAARATTDALTGLPNKAAFHERLEIEVERARRGGHALSLVVVDVDLFKNVNDTHGHPTGDAVLAETARRLGALARRGDLLARVGGEEFAWIMPDTDGHGAVVAADRARAAMSGQPFAGVGRLTLSAGVCDLDQGASPGELFRLADTALYWAKANGRDTVVRYAPEVVQLESAEGRTARIERSHKLGTISALAGAIDAKDPSTRAHSGRVAELAGRLAEACGWSSDQVALLREAGLVHDVGKIGVPDAVLGKDSRLTAREFEQVMRHPALGAEILSDTLSPEQVGWVRHHHERWDGRGYPDRLAADEIPPGARLLALADAWDAMTADRSYRRSRSYRDALEECRRERGRQFAPEAVDALERLADLQGLEDLDVVRARVLIERTVAALRS